MNNIINEKGLDPSRLVFGIILIFSILNTDLPTQKDRMHAIKTDQAELNSIVAERRLLTAITRDIPPAADLNYRIGEEIMFYNEDKTEWIGQLIVLDCTCIMETSCNPSTRLRQTYSAFQVKHYFRTINTNLVHLLFNSENGPPPFNIQLIEIIEPHDPGEKHFDEATKTEI